MGRKNHLPAGRTRQRGHAGKRRPDAHKKARSEGLSKTVRDLHGRDWWTAAGESV